MCNLFSIIYNIYILNFAQSSSLGSFQHLIFFILYFSFELNLKWCAQSTSIGHGYGIGCMCVCACACVSKIVAKLAVENFVFYRFDLGPEFYNGIQYLATEIIMANNTSNIFAILNFKFLLTKSFNTAPVNMGKSDNGTECIGFQCHQGALSHLLLFWFGLHQFGASKWVLFCIVCLFMPNGQFKP